MYIMVKGGFQVSDSCPAHIIDTVFQKFNKVLSDVGLPGEINELGNPANRPIHIHDENILDWSCD